MRRALVLAITFTSTLLLAPLASAQDLVQLDYMGFTLWMDCARRGALVARYRIGPDTDNIDKKISFRIDENLEDCQQTSTDTYNRPNSAHSQYDRGHLVPANHLDNNYQAYKESYLMTNVLPQERYFNQNGAWRETEKLIECWREDGPLDIWIGVVWGDNPENDHFVQSHGIATPDAFVKLVYQPGLQPRDHRAIAWFLPNQRIPAASLDKKIVPPLVVEAIIGRELNLPGVVKTQWAILDDWTASTSCDQS